MTPLAQQFFIHMIFGALLVVVSPIASAELQLDTIQFDPAIISSGDEVDIVVQFHQSVGAQDDNRLGNPAYTFNVFLSPDDDMVKKYITVLDSEGDDFRGMILSKGTYNKRFRVKVNADAPAGSYEFKLSGQWYFNSVPEGGSQFIRFMMPVKRQGIALSVSNLISLPEKIRSGDKEILLKAEISNSGEKTAKNVRLSITYPNKISSSYTNNNQLTLGVIEAGEKRDVQLYIDTDNALKSGVYQIGYTLSYEDTDNNAYTSRASFPIVIHKKPHVVVSKVEGGGFAGGNAQLKVTLTNTGDGVADATDARIIKQSSQPFEMDVRSDYVGQLNPNESAIALFTLHILPDAEIKDHRLTLLIRAKGDAEEGDENIYTFTESATLNVKGKLPNRYPWYAVIFSAIVLIVAAIFYRKRGKRAWQAKN